MQSALEIDRAFNGIQGVWKFDKTSISDRLYLSARVRLQHGMEYGVLLSQELEGACLILMCASGETREIGEHDCRETSLGSHGPPSTRK